MNEGWGGYMKRADDKIEELTVKNQQLTSKCKELEEKSRVFEEQSEKLKKEAEILKTKLKRERLENLDVMSVGKREDGNYDITVLITRFYSTIQDIKKCCGSDEKGHDQYLVSEELMNRLAEYVRHVYEVLRKRGHIKFE